MNKPEVVPHPDFADSGSILRDERLARAEDPSVRKSRPAPVTVGKQLIKQSDGTVAFVVI